MPDTLTDSIDACLPQTQCTRCGYPRCRDYADALARGTAAINRCPPGGDATIAALSRLLDQPVCGLDPAYGPHEPRARAEIREDRCIGCWKCIDVCPVDAIVGARKLLHTVIDSDCNGCGLCRPACPVDCIVLAPAPAQPDPGSLWPEYSRAETRRWRDRTEARRERLARRTRGRAGRATPPPDAERTRIRAEIRAAVERVRNRKARS